MTEKVGGQTDQPSMLSRLLDQHRIPEDAPIRQSLLGSVSDDEQMAAMVADPEGYFKRVREESKDEARRYVQHATGQDG